MNRTLSTGHPSILKRRQVRGDKTRVSHAATVKVHTKKYLCADRCGGRLREGGSWSAREAIVDGRKRDDETRDEEYK